MMLMSTTTNVQLVKKSSLGRGKGLTTPLPLQPPVTGLPLTLNTVAATGNSGASSNPVNPVLQLADGGNLLDACIKAKEPSSSSPYVGAIKAKIISHPHYYSLLTAYLGCNKVGAPPEVSARLTEIAQEVEARQRTALGGLAVATELELGQFVEAYHEMLLKDMVPTLTIMSSYIDSKDWIFS
ncbi:Homeotic protein knotted-1 [Zea mays]|uniref:Homeotic protein knotted-1 n=1 Tax=Zea mays TaxID=4577 RepID=A0A317Y333_MAIZE|nr:Homeotic protein knotted-1 [Zea mays]